jgi:hypothetical protein
LPDCADPERSKVRTVEADIANVAGEIGNTRVPGYFGKNTVLDKIRKVGVKAY